MSQEPSTRDERWRWALIKAAGGMVAILLLLACAALVALAVGSFQRMAAVMPQSGSSPEAPDQENLTLTPGVMYPVHGRPAGTRPPEKASDGQNALIRTNPSWLQRPSPEFPHAAQRGGVEAGSVVLTCQVLSDGRINECSVEEDPAGMGFGAAALASVKDARLNPARIDDVASEGRIRFTILFRLA